LSTVSKPIAQALSAKRFAEKSLGGGHVPLRAQPEIDSVAIPIHRNGPEPSSSAHSKKKHLRPM
jgi:hypothetical protein